MNKDKMNATEAEAAVVGFEHFGRVRDIDSTVIDVGSEDGKVEMYGLKIRVGAARKLADAIIHAADHAEATKSAIDAVNRVYRDIPNLYGPTADLEEHQRIVGEEWIKQATALGR